jgi:hypothetical protein
MAGVGAYPLLADRTEKIANRKGLTSMSDSSGFAERKLVDWSWLHHVGVHQGSVEAKTMPSRQPQAVSDGL